MLFLQLLDKMPDEEKIKAVNDRLDNGDTYFFSILRTIDSYRDSAFLSRVVNYVDFNKTSEGLIAPTNLPLTLIYLRYGTIGLELALDSLKGKNIATKQKIDLFELDFSDYSLLDWIFISKNMQMVDSFKVLSKYFDNKNIIDELLTNTKNSFKEYIKEQLHLYTSSIEFDLKFFLSNDYKKEEIAELFISTITEELKNIKTSSDLKNNSKVNPQDTVALLITCLKSNPNIYSNHQDVFNCIDNFIQIYNSVYKPSNQVNELKLINDSFYEKSFLDSEINAPQTSNKHKIKI